MVDRFSDEQIAQLKEAFEPMFTSIQQEFIEADEEREKDRIKFKEFRSEMNEFREETNGHFESLERRFHGQQESIDEHDQQFELLTKKPV